MGTSTPIETLRAKIISAARSSPRRVRDLPSASSSPRRAPRGAFDLARVELAVAIVAVEDREPVVDIVAAADSREPDTLPFALLNLGAMATIEQAMRASIEQQSGLTLGYLQQLLAFAGHASVGEREAPATSGSTVVPVLIGYLALARDRRERVGHRTQRSSRWQGCYRYMPWEDWRGGRPGILDEAILPHLDLWAKQRDPGLSRAALSRLQTERSARVRIAFAGPGGAWDEEKVLGRFDLLAEAGLIAEDRPALLATGGKHKTMAVGPADGMLSVGRPLKSGHRRILAAGIGRLRADLKTRPVIFELMDEAFSLFELQQTVEAIMGPHLHKQNFRRLIETARLVEPTGEMRSHTGGRPAKLYRFRRDVLLERPAPGLKIRT